MAIYIVSYQANNLIHKLIPRILVIYSLMRYMLLATKLLLAWELTPHIIYAQGLDNEN